MIISLLNIRTENIRVIVLDQTSSNLRLFSNTKSAFKLLAQAKTTLSTIVFPLRSYEVHKTLQKSFEYDVFNNKNKPELTDKVWRQFHIMNFLTNICLFCFRNWEFIISTKLYCQHKFLSKSYICKTLGQSSFWAQCRVENWWEIHFPGSVFSFSEGKWSTLLMKLLATFKQIKIIDLCFSINQSNRLLNYNISVSCCNFLHWTTRQFKKMLYLQLSDVSLQIVPSVTPTMQHLDIDLQKVKE